MIDWIIWYILITLLGWLAFPLAYRLLPSLPDRGYASSRALGLLLWGFGFWLLASMGVLPNRADGLLVAAAIVAGLSVLAWRSRPRGEISRWLRSRAGMVVAIEVLFLLAFAGWALVRAANPEAVGTEKPMELAFINAILNSPAFPPHDPWLSGYGISYYYFGYVLVGMLAKMSGAAGAVAFNLGISLVFALTALSVYGLVYDLLNARRREAALGAAIGDGGGADRSGDRRSQSTDPDYRPRYTIAALLGPLFVLLVSNLEGFLQLLHQNGVFWTRNAAGELVSPFWSWLDIKDLTTPPMLPPQSWAPDRFWWWWRASRVVQDYDLAGNVKEIIDEFPFFSYLLGDVHPHVLAMPFAMLAMTLALNLFLGGGSGVAGWPRLSISRRSLSGLGMAAVVAGMAGIGLGGLKVGRTLLALNQQGGLATAASSGAGGSLGLVLLGLAVLAAGMWALFLASPSAEEENHGILADVSVRMQPAFLLLCIVALGGMAFLNTWDFPMYVALMAAAYALTRLNEEHTGLWQAFKDFLRLGIVLGVGGVLFYLPFYLGFSSQAGGIIPNLVYPTRGAHLWVMFAPLLLPILAYLFYLAGQALTRGDFGRGILLAGGLTLGLWLAALAFAALITTLPQAGSLYLSTVGASDAGQLFAAAIRRRLTAPGGWLTLAILLAPALGLLAAWIRSHRESDRAETAALERAEVFAILLALLGGLLALGPEFFFLRDLFGWRMNTIFKFYFQVWLIWSAAAAYGSVRLLESLRGAGRAGYAVALTALLAAGLVYPALSLPSKTNNFNPTTWTLDSSAYYAQAAPDEMAAIEWLQAAESGVLAEAVPADGGQYSDYARFAKFTGKPGVLGWVGHENQWRGDTSAETIGSRQGDLQLLYCTREWGAAQEILERYHIRYVVVGQPERQAYPPGTAECPNGVVEVKFQRYLTTAFQAGNVTIYEYVGEEND